MVLNTNQGKHQHKCLYFDGENYGSSSIIGLGTSCHIYRKYGGCVRYFIFMCVRTFEWVDDAKLCLE